MIRTAAEALTRSREVQATPPPPPPEEPSLVPAYLAVALARVDAQAAHGKLDAYVTTTAWGLNAQPSDAACLLAVRRLGFWVLPGTYAHGIQGPDHLDWGVYPWWMRLWMRLDGWQAPLPPE